MKIFSIANREVGEGKPPLVIAELGINHNGDLDLARTMVDSAARAGAEIIKHQTHIPESEMAEDAKSIQPDNADQSIYDVIDSCHLDEDDEATLKDYVESRGMIFISTPFSLDAVDRLERFDVPAWKIGSGECNNLPMIRRILRTKKPIILSTGMNDIASIGRSVAEIEAAGVPYALLHCTNIYPTPYNQVRLAAIEQLREAFPKAVVGLSDHTGDIYTSVAALAYGASLFELHYTDHKQRTGPDIPASIDEQQLHELLRVAPLVQQSIPGEKGIVDGEQSVADFAFASVVAAQDIAEGATITADMLTVRRPGTGIPASDIDDVPGRIAAVAIAKGHVIKSEMLLA